MERKQLSLSDRMDYDWMTDMYDCGHEMFTTVTPNSLNEHIVNYGSGASRLISHDVWLAFQAYKKRTSKIIHDHYSFLTEDMVMQNIGDK